MDILVKSLKNKSLILGWITTPREGPPPGPQWGSPSLDCQDDRSNGMRTLVSSGDFWLDLVQSSLAEG